MRNLVDILEKLSLDDIKMSKRFPTSGRMDDVIDFLKDVGFNEIEVNYNMDFIGQLNKEKGKYFAKTGDTIYWADTSKGNISEKNPMFAMIDKRDYYFYYDKRFGQMKEIELKDLIKKLNEVFGWQI